MDESPAPHPPSPGPPQAHWEKTLFRMFVLLLLVGSGLYVFRSCRDLPADTVGRTVDKTVQVITNLGRSLVEVAAAFQQGTYVTSLQSTGTELESTKYFQFKKVRQLELFRHTDLATTAFGYLPLPEIVVEARAPVEYTYYLDLTAAWQMVLQDGVIHVFTPEIRFNRPSVDVSRLEYEVKKGSLLRDAEPAMENLRNSLTSLSYLKARENLRLVRDTGREPVAEFIQHWVTRTFTDGSNYAVRVYFPGEEAPPGIRRTVVIQGEPPR